MSIYRNSILAFIHVIKSQSHLISFSDWAELHKLTQRLSEDDEEISDIIEDWLQQEHRSNILQAYQEQFKKLDDSDSIDLKKDLGPARSVANKKRSTNPKQPGQSSLELLNNAIQRNSPLSDNK